MSNTYQHREPWLHALADALRPVFAGHGAAVPANIRISCGFPSRRAVSANSRSIGQCWASTASRDGTVEIMVSPVIEDPARVAGVLTHELVHAAVGIKAGHRAPFARLARALGLEGPMTATTEGEAFKQLVAPLLDAVGPYPHAALDASSRPKQSTRLIKVQCFECGYTVRITQKWLAHGAPLCPAHGEMLEEMK